MPDYTHRFKSIETNVVHAGAPRPNIEGAVVTPIFQSANYLMRDETEYDAVRYIRLSNSPNHFALAAKLAAIENGEAALVTASGMAAITTTLLTHAGAGDHILAQKTLYGGTQTFLDEDAPNFGLEYTSFDTADDPASWGKLLKKNTRGVYVEAISNPLIEVGNLKAVVEFARAHNLVTVIDNTFATPVNFRPLEIGFDVVIHSATKYLNGHSDIGAGAIITTAERIDRIRHTLNHLGGSLDPHACFLLERGLKTLALRVPRQNDNAARLAAFLNDHPHVVEVRHPSLSASPGHQWARELFSGFGGMVSFYTDSDARADKFLETVRIPLHAASLGGVETLVGKPASHSHIGLTDEQRRTLGITNNLIRVSTGIEDIDELIEDFGRGLG
ncbi:MAG TPA: PLP-dependent aspartate aminotransferase family protein [candidate division Zixibacteria bacterium]|nr:PLP-dependent aspartate aminotransferase family protein [candidate division Zixibacteria bacterium]